MENVTPIRPRPVPVSHWAHQHNQALASPRGFEVPIVGMRKALVDYAAEHKKRYESEVGEDYVIGDFWLQMARGYLGLLNGESGRLDCGALDSEMRLVALGCGFEDEL